MESLAIIDVFEEVADDRAGVIEAKDKIEKGSE